MSPSTRKNRRASRSAVVALLAAALAAAGPAAADVVVELVEPAGEEWLHPRDSIVLRVQTDDAVPRLAVLLGNRDISRLFRREAGHEMHYASDLLPLPSGEQELAVYSIGSARQWTELARFPVRILTMSGLEVADLDPRLDLTEASQFDEGRSADATAPPRRRYNDFAMQSGLATRHRLGDRELRSSWNVVGSSVREQALRFASEGADAPKIDLSDFLLEYQMRISQLALGHVSYGDHPLVLSGLSNRGVSYRILPFERLDFALTRQNAQSIVGYNNLSGLNDSDNHVTSASVGFELAPRPGAARLEALWLDARTRSLPDFNAGEVPDAEKNRAYGLRLTSGTESGRLSATASFGRSTYTNPPDPFLSSGFDVVPVEEATADARALEIRLGLLQNRPFGQGTASLLLGLRHERIEPLYRTVGAFVTPDLESNSVSLDGVLGQSAFQMQVSRAEDNLDDIPTILKTRTDSASFNYSMPLASILAPEGGRAWLPQNLTYNYQRMHQFGLNLPPSFDPLTHIPDQVSENHNVGFGWTLGFASLNYRLAYGLQDNRQPGRALADFRDRTHAADLSMQPADRLGLSIGVAYTSALDRAQVLDRHNLSYTFGFDWTIGQGLNLRGNYSLVEMDDSQELSDSRSYTAQTELYWRFEIPVSELNRRPVQLYLRHSLQSNQFLDNVFGFNTLTRNWALSGGFNVSLF